MKITNGELQGLSTSLSHMKNEDLPGDKAWKVILLQEELEKYVATYGKAYETIIKSFLKEGEEGIDKEDERYPSVVQKINEMNAEELKLSTYSFLNSTELMSACKGLQFDMIKYLKKYLIETTLEVVEME